MKWLKKLFHPLIAFIGVQLVWVLVVVSWIYWFISRHKELRQLAERYRPEIALHGYDWLVLVEGLILLVVILVGVYVIFLYWVRQTNLYKQQRSFISQVTHELKSPLASIQLHLETIRLRKPDPDKLDRFLDTMLEDTDRLNNLISNLLMAAKLDHRRYGAPYQVIDFSAYLTSFMERKRQKLPEGGSLIVEVEPGLKAAVDSESMGMALRNLFENAVLYSIASPEIKVTLQRSGERCFLTFQDSGRGIEKKNLKKVFQMFYRVRQPGDSTRGTGLGLYIVKSIVEEHGGKINVTSEGPGRGTRFLITLPLYKQRGGGNG
jgi:signal transduction histidine kinase